MPKRELCSFTKATLRHKCPHYKPGRAGYECRGFEQGITTVGSTTIYHCKHDPPKAEQLELSLQGRRNKDHQ